MISDYFVHKSSYIDDNVTIGRGTKIWHFCHVETGATIGENCVLGQNVYIGKGVIIGNNCKVQNNVTICSGVQFEDYVFCGPSCMFTNDLTPRSRYPKGSENYIKTLVKQGASIGANVSIVCGNIIGSHAMVGAGAVVTKDVCDYSLVMGMPARHWAWACECGERLPKDNICTLCSRIYRLEMDKLVPSEGCAL